jgi:hypothetical protein
MRIEEIDYRQTLRKRLVDKDVPAPLQPSLGFLLSRARRPVGLGPSPTSMFSAFSASAELHSEKPGCFISTSWSHFCCSDLVSKSSHVSDFAFPASFGGDGASRRTTPIYAIVLLQMNAAFCLFFIEVVDALSIAIVWCHRSLHRMRRNETPVCLERFLILNTLLGRSGMHQYRRAKLQSRLRRVACLPIPFGR